LVDRCVAHLGADPKRVRGSRALRWLAWRMVGGAVACPTIAERLQGRLCGDGWDARSPNGDDQIARCAYVRNPSDSSRKLNLRRLNAGRRAGKKPGFHPGAWLHVDVKGKFSVYPGQTYSGKSTLHYGRLIPLSVVSPVLPIDCAFVFVDTAREGLTRQARSASSSLPRWALVQLRATHEPFPIPVSLSSRRSHHKGERR
jgi:hypothetical protein